MAARLSSAAGVWTLALGAPLPAGSHDVSVETIDGRGRVATDQTRFEILVRAPEPEPAPPEPAPPEPAPVAPAPADVFEAPPSAVGGGDADQLGLF